MWTLERRQKQRDRMLGNTINLGRKISAISKEKNPRWKGNNVGYKALHAFMRKYLPIPKKCQLCGKKKSLLDCANITGIYNREPENWQYLCRSCHMNSDDRMKNLELGRMAGIKRPRVTKD